MPIVIVLLLVSWDSEHNALFGLDTTHWFCWVVLDTERAPMNMMTKYYMDRSFIYKHQLPHICKVVVYVRRHWVVGEFY